MPDITASATRRIITDFKNDIINEKQLENPPLKEIIDFRDDLTSRNRRDVYTVPLDYLRYRADNARISAEVKTFRQLERDLDERNGDDQNKIGDW